jgi:hypothetical protein
MKRTVKLPVGKKPRMQKKGATCPGPSHVEDEPCGRPVFGGGVCQPHYNQRQRNRQRVMQEKGWKQWPEGARDEELVPVMLQKPKAPGMVRRWGHAWLPEEAEAVERLALEKQQSPSDYIADVVRKELQRRERAAASRAS